MKRVNLIFLICVLVTVICGCEQEVKMPVAKNPYPVVYSVLNKNDTAHYVRLTKTFSGPVDATIMAQNPDSLYYKNARVFAEMGMTKIEMLPTAEIARDAGVFITGYNLMYKTTFRLCGNVVIHIYLPDYNTEVIGSTKLIPDLLFTAPDTLLKKEFSFFETEPVKIIWNGLKNICQTNIRFKYLEINAMVVVMARCTLFPFYLCRGVVTFILINPYFNFGVAGQAFFVGYFIAKCMAFCTIRDPFEV